MPATDGRRPLDDLGTAGNGSARLPNAQLAAECAPALGISADWLLGLSDRPEPIADLLARSLSLTEAPRALIDETHLRLASGGGGLQDPPCARHAARHAQDPRHGGMGICRATGPHGAEQAIGAFEGRLAWMRGAGSDYEIALPMHELDAFARAEGYYAGLPRDIRRAQLDAS